MAREGSDSGGGFAAIVLLTLAIAFVIAYIWWIVGAAALVGLFFAGRAVLRNVQERKELAARHERDLTLRADRQHRWMLAGDERGVYGREGASAMHEVSPPVMPPVQANDGDPPVIAPLATTAGELAALVGEKPSCWEWALFTSVLTQRQRAVLPRLRDCDLGFAPSTVTRIYSGAELELCLVGLIDDMLSTARQIQRFTAAPAFMASFGDGVTESSGDADAITHIAHRLMDYHERLLALSERCQSISAPSQYDSIVADCAQLLNTPLRAYRDFIAELVDVVESLPRFLLHDTDHVDLGTIALDLDVDDVPRVLKRLRAISR